MDFLSVTRLRAYKEAEGECETLADVMSFKGRRHSRMNRHVTSLVASLTLIYLRATHHVNIFQWQ